MSSPATATTGDTARAVPTLIVLAVAAFGYFFAGWLGTAVMGYPKSPVSTVMVAILAGLLLANLAPRVAALARPVLRRCTTTVLQVGIVLLGLKLSLIGAATLGVTALPVVIFCISTALAIVIAASRPLGLSRELGALIAVGTSICGVTAIAATAPLIRAREAEVSYATACISLFGITALLFYPTLAHQLFGDSPRLAGIFLGTAVHDTAQVAGAGLAFQQQFGVPGALEAATVTKLLRNLCMAVVIPGVAWVYRDRSAGGEDGVKRGPPVPLFVVGFILMCSFRSIGDIGDRAFGALPPQAWHRLLDGAQYVSEWALTIAMAAVGLQTRFSAFRTLGWKPFALGLFAAALVGVVSVATLFVLFRAS
jgi:uncharacterized integral membrane protein (TIGR00698 family)